MRFIPTKVHGVLDYLYVLMLFFIPSIFQFNPQSVASMMIDIVSSIVLVYSLFTKYELGVFKNIPMKVHLLFDCIIGISLIVSPWLFGFDNRTYMPYLFFGLFAIVASLLSKTTSDDIEKSTYAPGK